MQSKTREKWSELRKCLEDRPELLNQILPAEQECIVDNLYRSENKDSYVRCHFLINEVLSKFHTRDDAIAIAELLTGGSFFEGAFQEVRVSRTDGNRRRKR